MSHSGKIRSQTIPRPSMLLYAIGNLYHFLPVTSAAIKPSALMTFTWRNPTSFKLWNILSGLWKTPTLELGKKTLKDSQRICWERFLWFLSECYPIGSERHMYLSCTNYPSPMKGVCKHVHTYTCTHVHVCPHALLYT